MVHEARCTNRTRSGAEADRGDRGSETLTHFNPITRIFNEVIPAHIFLNTSRSRIVDAMFVMKMNDLALRCGKPVRDSSILSSTLKTVLLVWERKSGLITNVFHAVSVCQVNSRVNGDTEKCG